MTDTLISIAMIIASGLLVAYVLIGWTLTNW